MEPVNHLQQPVIASTGVFECGDLDRIRERADGDHRSILSLGDGAAQNQKQEGDGRNFDQWSCDVRCCAAPYQKGKNALFDSINMASTEISEEEQRRLTAQFLRDFIKATPNKKLRIGIVLVEDLYERSFGDGMTIYLQRAFWSLAAAKMCVEWIYRNQSPKAVFYGFTARDVEVSEDSTGRWNFAPLDGDELRIYSGDLERALVGNSSDWRESLSYVFGRKLEEPDFGDTPPDGWTALCLTPQRVAMPD
jgi:hypothetical protein